MHRRNLIIGGLTMATSATLPSLSTAADKFYVPAEEAPHEATIMQWPVSRDVYPDPVFLDMTQSAIARIANSVSQFEPVIMLAANVDHRRARKRLSKEVRLWDVPTEDLWCRDAGPIFVTDGSALAIRHIQFNGWGEKQLHSRDGRIAETIANRLGVPLLPSTLKGEAGGVEQDGHGLLMAHESSWVNDNRNPAMGRDEIETALLDAYGAERMIWSPGVWGEDITDYHIDSLARFTGAGRVLINLPASPSRRDPFHMAALDTHDALKAAGLEMDVIYEPETRRIKSADFVASYANYYVCNGAVIAAQFGDPNTDAEAVSALKRHYPGREIVTLNVDPLGELGGGIHCATQQIPAV